MHIAAILTDEERNHAVELLERSSREYLALIENLIEAQWNWKPAPDRWSVAETAEHVVLAEELLFGGVQKIAETPANPAWQAQTAGKTEFLQRVLLDRSQKAQSPPPGVPHGIAKAEAMRRFGEVRSVCSRFARETQFPLKEHTQDHPAPSYGTLNAYHWLIYIPLHNLRHNLQIAEVKACPGFPR